jgi:hypothetical protein
MPYWKGIDRPLNVQRQLWMYDTHTVKILSLPNNFTQLAGSKVLLGSVEFRLLKVQSYQPDLARYQ